MAARRRVTTPKGKKRTKRRLRPGMEVQNHGTFQNVFWVARGQRLEAMSDTGLKVVIRDDTEAVVGLLADRALSLTRPAVRGDRRALATELARMKAEGLVDAARALVTFWREHRCGAQLTGSPEGELLLEGLEHALAETGR